MIQSSNGHQTNADTWTGRNWRVALNPIIQSSDRVPPKADTWTGRNWQGRTQSNNPEFGMGTTESGYMGWTSLARVRIGVPPHEWDATGQVVIQYSGSLMASVAEPLYPKSGPHLRAWNTNVKQVETNPRSVRNTGVNSGPFLRLTLRRHRPDTMRVGLWLKAFRGDHYFWAEARQKARSQWVLSPWRWKRADFWVVFNDLQIKAGVTGSHLLAKHKNFAIVVKWLGDTEPC
ncbi:hypothetical protein B0H14DRAFT_3157768 [Mycena olivaceomarginata]|nr:hypothetical protein B0H14DRAFT_3157768 [Mycena olivaceomarginata]